MKSFWPQTNFGIFQWTLEHLKRCVISPYKRKVYACYVAQSYLTLCDPIEHLASPYKRRDVILIRLSWFVKLWRKYCQISDAKLLLELPTWLSGKESACNAGDTGNAGLMIPGTWRSSGGGNGNPLQYSCQENPVSEEAGGLYSLWVLKESDMTEHTCIYTYMHSF